MNGTADKTFELPPRPTFLVVLESSVAIVFVILALLGNSMVYIAIFRNKSLRKVPNYLLLNLSTADMLSALISLPLLISVLVNGRWTLGEDVCQFSAFQTYASYACSLLTMAVTSVTRYFATVHPVKHRAFFRTRSLLVILFAIWLFSFTFASMPLVGWGRYKFEPYYALCVHEENSSASYSMFLFCYLIVSSTVIVACYLKIFKAMKKRHLQIQLLFAQGIRSKQERLLSEQEIKLTNTIFIVICLFAICYLPTMAQGFVMLAKVDVPRFARMLSTFCVALSSVVNPLVYWVRSKGFRDAIITMSRLRTSGVNPRRVDVGENPECLNSSQLSSAEKKSAQVGVSSLKLEVQ